MVTIGFKTDPDAKFQFFKPVKESKEYIFSQLQKEYKVATDTTETTTTSTSGGSGGY